ncbi:hypothetical protein D3C85_1025200 [compost metagenome]
MRLLGISLGNGLVLCLGEPGLLPDLDGVAQLEAVVVDGHVAVEQQRVDRLPAGLGGHPGDVIGGAEIGAVGAQAVAEQFAGLALEHLVAPVPVEGVAEVAGRRAMHRPEVRSIGEVVHQFAAVGLDHHLAHLPLGPLRRVTGLDARDIDRCIRCTAFGVVPYVQQLVLLQGRPGLDPCPRRDTFAVGNGHALAIAAPLPVVEGADHGIAFHLPTGEVRAHVRAVAIEDVHRAILATEGDEAGAEDVQRMGFAIGVVSHQAEAMPAAGEAPCRTVIGSRPFHAVLLKGDGCRLALLFNAGRRTSLPGTSPHG